MGYLQMVFQRVLQRTGYIVLIQKITFWHFRGSALRGGERKRALCAMLLYTLNVDPSECSSEYARVPIPDVLA